MRLPADRSNDWIYRRFCALFCAGVHGQLLTNIPPPSTSYVQIYALPVGQGDCTIIQCPSSGDIIVFDCGSSGANGILPSDVQAFLGSSIDKVRYILVTHANQDHFNYLYQITWNTSSVMAVIIGGMASDYNNNVNMRNWLSNWNTINKLYMVNNGVSCIGSTNCLITNAKMPSSTIATNFCSNPSIPFSILATNVGSSANQKSIVMKIVQGGWSMLLSGDMEGAASVTIAMNLGTTLQSTVYKISHHGASAMANKVEWLNPIKPTFAFASNGYAFRNCRHPRCITIDRLLSLNTITTTTPHNLYCGGTSAMTDMNNSTFQYNILETSPTSTLICFLTYTSSGALPGSHCGTSTLTADTNDGVFDDECLSTSQTGGTTLSMTAHPTLLVIMMMFSFIIIIL